MKRLTCKDLGGPCNAEIAGDSFEEMKKKSYEHVLVQINRGDEAHRAAAVRMRNAPPEQRRAKMAEFEKKFSEAPEA